MSTSAESALQWLDREQPDNDQIQEVITKLEHRIRSNNADDDQLEGSKDALALLQEVLTDRMAEQQGDVTPNQPAVSTNQDSNLPDLDLSGLGEPATIQEENLTEEEKRARFERLKSALGKS